MQGARVWARDAIKVSSAEVSSMSRVKWVVIASSVAILARRSWPRVFWRTDTRASAEVADSGLEYMVLIIS